MPDEHNHDDIDNAEEPERRVPASVTFMEMMRQAAARRIQAEAPPPPDKPQTPTIPTDTTPAKANIDPAAIQAHAERRAAALEAEKVRRVQRRKERRRERTVGVFAGMMRAFFVVLVAAMLVATIFTWVTPTDFIAANVRSELSIAQAIATQQQADEFATPVPTPNWLRRIGIVAGHRGPEGDPGAICPDGLQEADVNFNVAQLVARQLRARGYSVDLLDEFDPRLDGFQAAALVSLHSNTCQQFDTFFSGFVIAQAAARPINSADSELVDCVARHYQQASELRRLDTLTRDMTDYHTFREIDINTPAVILEMGFLLADRAKLTGEPDVLARGITDGIVCFLEPGSEPDAGATPEAGA